MTEHGILFSSGMIQAIQKERKTQTRRVLTPEPCGASYDPSLNVTGKWEFCCDLHNEDEEVDRHLYRCHHVGDRLWVRETFAIRTDAHSGKSQWLEGPLPKEKPQDYRVIYKADGGDAWSKTSEERGFDWRPSIFMPRWASRITLEVREVRAQRVQEITEKDAQSEGVEKYDEFHWTNYLHIGQPDLAHPRQSFATLWDSINADRGYSWESNPWVFAITFRRVA